MIAMAVRINILKTKLLSKQHFQLLRQLSVAFYRREFSAVERGGGSRSAGKTLSPPPPPPPLLTLVNRKFGPYFIRAGGARATELKTVYPTQKIIDSV